MTLEMLLTVEMLLPVLQSMHGIRDSHGSMLKFQATMQVDTIMEDAFNACFTCTNARAYQPHGANYTKGLIVHRDIIMVVVRMLAMNLSECMDYFHCLLPPHMLSLLGPDHPHEAN